MSVTGIGTDAVKVHLTNVSNGIDQEVWVPVNVPANIREQVGTSMARYIIAGELGFAAVNRMAHPPRLYPTLVECLSGATLGHKSMSDVALALNAVGQGQAIQAVQNGVDFGVIGCFEGTHK